MGLSEKQVDELAEAVSVAAEALKVVSTLGVNVYRDVTGADEEEDLRGLVVKAVVTGDEIVWLASCLKRRSASRAEWPKRFAGSFAEEGPIVATVNVAKLVYDKGESAE